MSGDEIISDTYPLIDIDDVVYEVNCRKMTKGVESFDIGANPSAEEAEEGLDDKTEQVLDVVASFRLNALEGAFPTKKDFAGQLKGMCDPVLENENNGAPGSGADCIGKDS